MPRTIALLGPPGCGKGTQAARLRDDLGFAPLATGDLLREARARGTELGRRAAEYMDRGELVPDDVVIAALEDALAHVEGRSVVLDGFPRTVAQAEALERALAHRGRELGEAILVDVPDDVVAERIRGRHEGRPDDNPETVRERLRVYHKETEPLVDYYERRGRLKRVDGARDPDAVHTDVRTALLSGRQRGR
jgi:adenylate kinase